MYNFSLCEDSLEELSPPLALFGQSSIENRTSFTSTSLLPDTINLSPLLSVTVMVITQATESFYIITFAFRQVRVSERLLLTKVLRLCEGFRVLNAYRLLRACKFKRDVEYPSY
ncbi:hypothetical protein CDAR_196011 [Caerostris darwini]|uniref:Uncharacterized protein n=1 Tax=Caerostris darwini TaxID=1538125 RepID=A0AAV4MHW6_9ARAC|nr:hypothetical protein CDAR_196011 [Caerostris darwini]